jgi:hypothetical protein
MVPSLRSLLELEFTVAKSDGLVVALLDYLTS